MARKKKNFQKKGGNGRKKIDERTASVEFTPVKSTNHMEWYSNNPSLLKDAASLNFSKPMGSTIELPLDSNIQWPDNERSIVSVPITNAGIASLRTMLVPGVSTDPTSAVNVSARDVYSFVRHENSGGRNYDATQLMFYFLAVDQLHAWHEYLRRIYGAFTNFSQRNQYFPRGIIQAMGVDYNDLLGRMADFRWLINYTADRASIFHIPDESKMPILARHKYMFSKIYCDKEIADKSQMYMFVPDGYFVWSELERPFKLTYTRFPNNMLAGSSPKFKLDDLRRITEEIISPLIESEDAQIISGDIYKAYGEGSLLKWNQITEDYSVIPEFDVGMLTQIHNLDWIGTTIYTENLAGVRSNDDMAIEDDINNNVIYFKPVSPLSHRSSYDGKFFNLPFSWPQPEDVMRGTRLCLGFSAVSDGTHDNSPFSGSEAYITTCGSEIVTQIFITSIQHGVSPLFRVDEVKPFINGASYTYELADTLSKVNQFDWFPNYGIVTTNGQKETRLYPVMADAQNWTIIDDATLADINHTAIMSEFNIPIL